MFYYKIQHTKYNIQNTKIQNTNNGLKLQKRDRERQRDRQRQTETETETEREREREKESERESKREKERLTGSFNIDSDMKECVAVIDADTLRRGKAGEIK